MQVHQIKLALFISFITVGLLSFAAPVNKHQAEKTRRQTRIVKQPGKTSTQEYMLGVGEADTKTDKELIVNGTQLQPGLIKVEFSEFKRGSSWDENLAVKNSFEVFTGRNRNNNSGFDMGTGYLPFNYS